MFGGLTPPMVHTAVQSFSVCTVQLYLYFPHGPYNFTEPQFLYSRATPLHTYGPYGLYRASMPVE